MSDTTELRESMESIERIMAVRYDLIDAFRTSTERNEVDREEARQAVLSFWQSMNRAFEQTQEAS